jgi:hypothetical protein
MVEEIKENISYLAERSESIRRYSRKLRDAIKKIENIFGERTRCRICHKDLEIYANCVIDREKAKEIINTFVEHDVIFSKYADALDDEHKRYAFHKFVPCIEINAHIRDTEPFFVENDKKYYLAFRNCELAYEVYDENEEMVEWGYITILNVDAIKALVKSQRLIKFLSYVAEKLRTEENELKEVSEIAEKIAQVVRPHREWGGE